MWTCWRVSHHLFLFSGHGQKLTVDMVDLLVGDPAVVLQDVEVLCANGSGNLLGDGQQLGEAVVRDVCELLAVVLGDDELDDGESG
jgi:hypothetical protein